MSYPEKDVEELVHGIIEWADKDPTNNSDARLAILELIKPFRPKPPRVGIVCAVGVNYRAPVGVNYRAVELTDEVRKALADAGIKWEETT